MDTDYQGESMLRIQGSVTMPAGFAATELVPALVFAGVSDWQRANAPRPTPDHERILDVGVTGEFPASFTLDVFEPPPAQAIHALYPAQPPFATGRVAAVAPGHPSAITRLVGFVPGASGENSYQTLTCLFTGACDANCAYSPMACDPTCYQGAQPWPPPSDPTICHHELYDCQDPAENPYTCAPSSASGNPSLAIAGYSRNVRVLYFPEPVPADSLVSFLHGGGGAPLSAGYHLVNLNPIPAPPDASDSTCAGRLPWDMAVESYNSLHGTNRTLEDFDGPAIDTPEYWEFVRLQYVARRELGCPDDGTRIDSQTSGITIDLGLRQLLE